MAKGYDENLNPLFEQATDEELMPIVEILLKNSNNSLSKNYLYKKNKKRPSEYIRGIVNDIKEFGGNSIANFFRSEGVNYTEIVIDVADKLSIDYKDILDEDENFYLEDLEWKILTFVLEKAYEEMPNAEKKKIEDILKENGFSNFSTSIPIGVILAQLSIGLSGILKMTVAELVVSWVTKSVLGHGLLSFGASMAVRNVVSVFAGPIGWSIMGIWSGISVTGPAFRTTIPLVCYIAYLRMKINEEIEKDEVNELLKSAFDILEANENSTWEEIKKSRDNKMKFYHPDKKNFSVEICNQKTIEINNAFEIIKKHFHGEK
jgi:uncharacterized protein YaaW (UPF0174 family)